MEPNYPNPQCPFGYLWLVHPWRGWAGCQPWTWPHWASACCRQSRCRTCGRRTSKSLKKIKLKFQIQQSNWHLLACQIVKDLFQRKQCWCGQLTNCLQPFVNFFFFILEASESGNEDEHLSSSQVVDDGVELGAVADHGQKSCSVRSKTRTVEMGRAEAGHLVASQHPEEVGILSNLKWHL